MFRIIILFVALCSVGNAFSNFHRTSRTTHLSEKAPEAPEQPKLKTKVLDEFETRVKGDAPWGKPFFQADIGVPAMILDYGGGDIGGNDYNDAMFSCGPRGKNKPGIKDVGVVTLPDLTNGKGYRGHHDLRRPDGTMATYDAAMDVVQKKGGWTKAEDDELVALIKSEPDGTRGRWTRIAKKTGRAVSDCSTRWLHVLNPDKDKGPMKDIIRDNERINDPRKGVQPWWLKNQEAEALSK